MSTEAPYYGSSRKWYDELVRFSHAYLPAARNEMSPETVPQGQRSLFSPDMLQQMDASASPEALFAYLTREVSKTEALSLIESPEQWLMNALDAIDQDVQPLLVMAMAYSIDKTVPNLTWLGVRVGKILTEYVEALKVIYEDAHEQRHSTREVHEAKIARDEIEFFCAALFRQELKTIRTFLARFVPEHFLYTWEELDEHGNIVLRDLRESGRRKP
jgi:hypothetical protein